MSFKFSVFTAELSSMASCYLSNSAMSFKNKQTQVMEAKMTAKHQLFLRAKWEYDTSALVLVL